MKPNSTILGHVFELIIIKKLIGLQDCSTQSKINYQATPWCFPCTNMLPILLSLQQLFSSIPLAKFYCFKSTPDLIFTKKTASTSAAGSVLYVVEELAADFIEIKHGSHFSGERLGNIPNAYVQVVGGYIFWPLLKSLVLLKAKKHPVTGVNCKALL